MYAYPCTMEAKAAAMKMKFMAVNARDGENVEQSVLTLVADTIAHQKAHSNDVVDPWSTPHADNQQAVRVCNSVCKDAYYKSVYK